MFSLLLAFHSALRWLVLLSLLLGIARAYRGLRFAKKYMALDQRMVEISIILVLLQFCLGMGLYFNSAIVSYFYENFTVAIHERQPRFFGLEHITVMVSAVILLFSGFAKAKEQKIAKDKFKTIVRYFSIGLLLILSSIPWAFSPLLSRPYFRFF